MPDDQELLDLAASLRDDVQPTKADQVRGQLKAAETYNPDAYANAMKAGAKKGVKPQVVLQDPKAFEDRPNAEELVVLSPKTADWILEHFDNAVVGGDDVKNLSRLEDLPRLVAAPPPTFTDRVRGLFRSAMEGTLFSSEQEAQAIRQAESARQQTERRFGLKPGEFHTGAVTALPTARIAAGLARGTISPMAGLASFAERKTGIDLGLGRVGKSLVGALTPQAPTLADVATENVASTLGLLIPSMGVSKAVQLTTKIPALAKYPRAARILGDWAGPVAMALPEAAAEAESAYDQNIAQGMEPAQASRRADGAFMSNLVLLAATDKITWFGKGPQWRKSLSEAIQEGGQQVTGNIATDRPVLEGTAEAAGTGAAIATAIPVLGKFLGQLVTTRGMRYATPLEMAQKEIIQNLADTAKDSKLLQRSPEDFAKAAQAIAPVEHIRISPEAYTTYFQSKNIDPVKMAETLGIQNFEEASVSGTDLLIPTGAYAAHLAASEHHAELSQDLRLGEDMMTPREAAAAEATKGQVEEVGQAVSLEVDEATQAGTEFQAIQEDLKARYIQAGETPAVADTYALDMAKVFYTLAQREGLNPQELMAQYAPKIVRGQAPMPEQVVAEAFTPETFPEEGVQWWEKDDLWFQGAYGEQPQKVETAPGVVQAPFRQTEFQGQLEDYQKTGQWYYNERRMVPLAAIEEKAPWDEGRRVDAETRLKDTAATTPVLLATEDGGKTFKIQDGIHRIAAAKAQGFTAIPAEVQVVVSDRAPTEGDFAGKDLLRLSIEDEIEALTNRYSDLVLRLRKSVPKHEWEDEGLDDSYAYPPDFDDIEEIQAKHPDLANLLAIAEFHEYGGYLVPTFGNAAYGEATIVRIDSLSDADMREFLEDNKGKDWVETLEDPDNDNGLGVDESDFPGITNYLQNSANLKAAIEQAKYEIAKEWIDDTENTISHLESKDYFDLDESEVEYYADRFGLPEDSETVRLFVGGEIDEDEALRRADIISARHDETEYDALLAKGYTKEEARDAIKEKMAEIKASSRTDPRILYQAAKPAPVFYSALSRAIPEIKKIAAKDGTLSPAQTRAWIEARQKEGKFKKEELETVLVERFIAVHEKNKQKFTADDLIEFVGTYQVKTNEVIKDEPQKEWGYTDFDGEWHGYNTEDEAKLAFNSEIENIKSNIEIREESEEGEERIIVNYSLGNDDLTLWKATKKEGGTYWETDPTITGKIDRFEDVQEINKLAEAEKEKEQNYYVNKLGELSEKVLDEYADQAKFSGWRIKGGWNYKELLVTYEGSDLVVRDTFEGGHWQEGNVVVHLRFDERKDEAGKKVLFINEIQSDWGQQFRKGDTDIEGPWIKDTKSWITLGIKRALRYASDNRFEKIVFANGKENAALYDLRKQIDELHYKKNENGTYNIDGFSNGIRNNLASNVKREELSNVVGVEIAKKIDADEGVESNGFKALSGEDLQVGGEGMIKFYDQIVPQAAKDLLKKLGGSLTKTTLEIEGEPVEHNAIDVTPQLAGTVQAGLPLFQSQKDDFSFGSKAWNEYYRSQVGSRARAKGDQAARAKKALEAAGTKRGQAEFDAEREAALRAEEEAFMQFDRAVAKIKQGAEDPRGWFTREDDGTLVIGKTPKGDFSSFVHEPAHVYLEMFRDLSTREGASERIKDDAAKVLKFLGVERWDQIGTTEHERFAEASEVYCREGKSPSEALRGVFERFRIWLKMVYVNIKNYTDVELNDDIRGVFDRMRATDEEIELAHADIAGPRLFRTAEEAGMTEKDFQRYAREKDLEVEQAKGEILAKLNAAAVREKTREWKEEAANVRAAIEQWVDAQPNFRAVAVLRAGKLEDGTPFTIKKDALVEQFGEERTGALHKAHPGIYRLEGELDAETAAEILGFESGEALMAALEETPKRGEVIKSEVQRVMTERHGDIRYDGTLEDQALQAVANDQRAKGLHRELEALKRKVDAAPSQARIQSLKDQIAKLEAEAKAQVKEKDEDAAFLAKQANALAETNEQLRARLEARDAKIQALKDQLAQAEAERKQDTREDRAEAKTARAMVPPMQAFREEAKRLIDAKQIKNLNPNAYINAQRKYSREAHVQALKGAYFESAQAKQKELLNHFLYLEATKAKDESEKAYKYVHRLMKPAAMEAIAKAGGEGGQRVYWDQIQNILNEYQFVRVPSRNLRDIALFAKENEENGIVFDPATLPGAKNYRELTLPELQAVVDALKNIEHVARAEGKILQKMKEIDLKVEVKEAKEAAYKNHTGKLKPIPAAGEALTLKEKLPRSIGGWRAYLGKMEWWIDKLDGGDINGPWRRNLMTPIREAGGNVQTAAHRINGELKKLYATMPKSFNENLDKETPVQFPGREKRLTRRQLRTWALNLGTEENRNVALLGEGLMDGMGILSPEYDKALKELTSDEWRFIQGVWDIFETLRPEVEAQALRTTGIAPKWKKSTPFKVKAKDGPEIQIRGGYYPLKADPYRSQVGERQADVDLPVVGITTRPTTSTSHLQKVTGATYRLNLDYVQGVTKHINDVLLNTYAGEAIRDVYKFIRQPEIKQALQETLGHEYYQEMLPWLQDFTNSNRIAAMEDKMVLQPLMRFKSAMVVSKLGFNLLSHVVQVTDPIKAVIDPDMKLGYLMKGYAALAADPAKYQEIRDLSPGLMRYRAENWNRDLKEMLDYPGPFKGKMEAFRQFSMQGFAVMDKLATSGAWWGRYQQGLDTHGDQAQAILEADRLVARDFQAGAPENMARVMRSKGWMNLLTTFGGDANTWFGILDASLRSGSPKRLGVVLMALLAEQMLSQLIRNRAPEDDEEAEWLLEQMGQSVFNKLPIIGDFLEAVIQQIQGKRADLSNPVLQGAEKVLAAPYRTIYAYQNQDDAEKAAMESIEALGTVFGVPGTAQGLKSWRYVRQVDRGERPEPENALEATRNVTLGPPPKGRQ